MARCRLVVVSRGCGIADWPSLRDGLSVIQPGVLASGVLRELARLSFNQRLERAHRARELAIGLNNRCIEHWDLTQPRLYVPPAWALGAYLPVASD